jgi:hypothetical protein
MRALVLLLLWIGAPAMADDPDGDRRRAVNGERFERLRRAEARANEVRPRRRDGPLRYPNISDDEVREVQMAVAAKLPRDILNIAGVVTGCPCEEGLQCTDQVWVVVSRPGGSVGLLLSRIDRHWMIGPVQRWWLRYEELRARMRTEKNYYGLLAAEEKLFEQFPACESPLTIPVDTGKVRTGRGR